MIGELVWVDPEECVPPHAVTRIEDYRALRDAFRESGWDASRPVLLGYRNPETFSESTGDWMIQLITGSHRWHAAVDAPLKKIPVWLSPFNHVKTIWGTDDWMNVVKNPPILRDLVGVNEGTPAV